VEPINCRGFNRANLSYRLRNKIQRDYLSNTYLLVGITPSRGSIRFPSQSASCLDAPSIRVDELITPHVPVQKNHNLTIQTNAHRALHPTIQTNSHPMTRAHRLATNRLGSARFKPTVDTAWCWWTRCCRHRVVLPAVAPRTHLHGVHDAATVAWYRCRQRRRVGHRTVGRSR